MGFPCTIWRKVGNTDIFFLDFWKKGGRVFPTRGEIVRGKLMLFFGGHIGSSSAHPMAAYTFPCTLWLRKQHPNINKQLHLSRTPETTR